MARWYRQDGNADSNPKMIRAGFWGRVAFQALCRVSADHELGGMVPLQYADPEYLAERLRLAADPDLAPLWAAGDSPVEVMRRGVTRAVSAGLAGSAPNAIFLCGWEERNSDGDGKSTERVRKHREKKRLEALAAEAGNVPGNAETLRNTRTDGRTDDTDGRTRDETPPAAASPVESSPAEAGGTAPETARNRSRVGLTPEAQHVRQVIAEVFEDTPWPPSKFRELEARLSAGDLSVGEAEGIVRMTGDPEHWWHRVSGDPQKLFRAKNYPGLLRDFRRRGARPPEVEVIDGREFRDGFEVVR